MLIACVHVDRGSDGEVIKSLYSVLVSNSRTVCELPDTILQFAADSIVVKADTEAVVLAIAPETTGKKCHARISIDRICSCGCSIPDASEHPQSTKRLCGPQLFGNLRRV